MTAGAAPGGLVAHRRYLRQFDLYRVVACLCVIAQHSVLRTVPGGSAFGWSLVMVLHATREVFFFLAALLAAYSQIAAPRTAVAFWVRRIGLVLVPYLAWTAIYFGYTALTPPPGFDAASTFVLDLERGYYQLYFLVVLFQVYLVLPAVIWLVRRTRGHHGVVLVASLALQVAMATLSYYVPSATGAVGGARSVDGILTGTRLVTSYQLYIVAGVLAADHLDTLQRVVEARSRAILRAVLAVGLATEGLYAYGVSAGSTPGHSSDLVQPAVVVWFLAACAGLWAAGWRWARRSVGRAPTRRDRFVTWVSDASGGLYLAHILVLEMVFSALGAAGLTAKSHWWAGGLVLYVATVAGTTALVAVLMRTRLRWVLTGPVRARERAALPAYPPGLARDAGAAAPSVPSLTRSPAPLA